MAKTASKPVSNRYVVGQRYANRKGEYEVVALDGESMTIRYDDGTTADAKVADQTRISQNMRGEAAEAARAAARPAPRSPSPRGKE